MGQGQSHVDDADTNIPLSKARLSTRSLPDQHRRKVEKYASNGCSKPLDKERNKSAIFSDVGPAGSSLKSNPEWWVKDSAPYYFPSSVKVQSGPRSLDLSKHNGQTRLTGREIEPNQSLHNAPRHVSVPKSSWSDVASDVCRMQRKHSSGRSGNSVPKNYYHDTSQAAPNSLNAPRNRCDDALLSRSHYNYSSNNANSAGECHSETCSERPFRKNSSTSSASYGRGGYAMKQSRSDYGMQNGQSPLTGRNFSDSNKVNRQKSNDYSDPDAQLCQQQQVQQVDAQSKKKESKRRVGGCFLAEQQQASLLPLHEEINVSGDQNAEIHPLPASSDVTPRLGQQQGLLKSHCSGSSSHCLQEQAASFGSAQDGSATLQNSKSDLDVERRARVETESRLVAAQSEVKRMHAMFENLQRDRPRKEPAALPSQSEPEVTVAASAEASGEASKDQVAKLMKRIELLETQRDQLVCENKQQRAAYDKMLDDIAKRVAKALLNQKSLKSENFRQQRRTLEVEFENRLLRAQLKLANSQESSESSNSNSGQVATASATGLLARQSSSDSKQSSRQRQSLGSDPTLKLSTDMDGSTQSLMSVSSTTDLLAASGGQNGADDANELLRLSFANAGEQLCSRPESFNFDLPSNLDATCLDAVGSSAIPIHNLSNRNPISFSAASRSLPHPPSALFTARNCFMQHQRISPMSSVNSDRRGGFNLDDLLLPLSLAGQATSALPSSTSNLISPNSETTTVTGVSGNSSNGTDPLLKLKAAVDDFYNSDELCNFASEETELLQQNASAAKQKQRKQKSATILANGSFTQSAAALPSFVPSFPLAMQPCAFSPPRQSEGLISPLSSNACLRPVAINLEIMNRLLLQQQQTQQQTCDVNANSLVISGIRNANHSGSGSSNSGNTAQNASVDSPSKSPSKAASNLFSSDLSTIPIANSGNFAVGNGHPSNSSNGNTTSTFKGTVSVLSATAFTDAANVHAKILAEKFISEGLFASMMMCDASPGKMPAGGVCWRRPTEATDRNGNSNGFSPISSPISMTTAGGDAAGIYASRDDGYSTMSNEYYELLLPRNKNLPETLMENATESENSTLKFSSNKFGADDRQSRMDDFKSCSDTCLLYSKAKGACHALFGLSATKLMKRDSDSGIAGYLEDGPFAELSALSSQPKRVEGGANAEPTMRRATSDSFLCALEQRQTCDDSIDDVFGDAERGATFDCFTELNRIYEDPDELNAREGLFNLQDAGMELPEQFASSNKDSNLLLEFKEGACSGNRSKQANQLFENLRSLSEGFESYGRYFDSDCEDSLSGNYSASTSTSTSMTEESETDCLPTVNDWTRQLKSKCAKSSAANLGRSVIRYSPPEMRPSILRRRVFARFGPQEKAALSQFDFLRDECDESMALRSEAGSAGAQSHRSKTSQRSGASRKRPTARIKAKLPPNLKRNRNQSKRLSRSLTNVCFNLESAATARRFAEKYEDDDCAYENLPYHLKASVDVSTSQSPKSIIARNGSSLPDASMSIKPSPQPRGRSISGGAAPLALASRLGEAKSKQSRSSSASSLASSANEGDDESYSSSLFLSDLCCAADNTSFSSGSSLNFHVG